MNGKNKAEITGMRSGRLTAVCPTDLRRKGSVLWLCRCDCGKTVLQPAYNIRAGRVRSCGCARSDAYRLDITGDRYGRLTVIRPAGQDRNRKSLWECRCECGNTVIVPIGALRSGNTKSCGCARKEALQNNRELSGTVYDHTTHIDGTCLELLDSRRRSDNTSGYRGVHRQGGKWVATIGFKGESRYLGIYPDIKDAVRAREAAEKELFEPFLREHRKKKNTQEEEHHEPE